MPVDLPTLLATAERLPSPPGVALELLSLAQKPDVDVDQLVAVIARDPALVTKILRVANTPLFGARKVATIKQALMTLGLRTVQVMTLSFSMVQPAAGSSIELEFWRNALTAAVAARVIATRWLPKQADECFVAGLLLDLGVMTARLAWPQKYTAVDEATRSRRCDGLEEERAALGADHMAIGSALLRKWALPATICDAVDFHHEQAALPVTVSTTTRDLVRVTGMAALVERCLRPELIGRDEEQLRVDLEQIRKSLAASFGATDQDLSLMFQEIRKGLREMAAVFNVPLADPRQQEELQVRTSRMLVALFAAAAAEQRSSAAPALPAAK